MSERCSLTPTLRLLGPGFLARMALSPQRALLPLGVTQRNVLWRTRRNWHRTRQKPCLPWVTISIVLRDRWQVGKLSDYGAAKTTFERVSKTLPSSSEVPFALAVVARREGHWDQSVAYWEQALALDPRNVQLLMLTAETYSMLRQFPTALKLYDRALDITPNDPDAMSSKAGIYQAQGNLQEAASLLSQINKQIPSEGTFKIKITQLRLERNYDEAVRLLQARLTQFHYASESRQGQ